jgi:hypothetical protein
VVGLGLMQLQQLAAAQHQGLDPAGDLVRDRVGEGKGTFLFSLDTGVRGKEYSDLC